MKISELREFLEVANELVGNVDIKIEQYGMLFDFSIEVDEENNIVVIS
jgi:hypothetical protein